MRKRQEANKAINTLLEELDNKIKHYCWIKMNIQHNKKNIIDLIAFYDYKFHKAKVQNGGSSYLWFLDKQKRYEIRFADHSKRRKHKNTTLLKNYVFEKPEGLI